MTRKNIEKTIQKITDFLVIASIGWLTLLEVHTGWGKELPLMLYILLTMGGMALLAIISKILLEGWCWIDKAMLVWFAYITFNYWFVSPYPIPTKNILGISEISDLYMFHEKET